MTRYWLYYRLDSLLHTRCNRLALLLRHLSWFLLLCLVTVPGPASALDLHQSLPSSTSATFNTVNQTFLQREDANRTSDMWGTGWVVSACLGATSGSKVMATFACTAYTNTGFYVNQASASIDFGASPGPACADADTGWVIATMDTTAAPGGNFVRVTGTRYAVDCTTVTQPAVPTDAVMLMEVAISGAAITTVTDLRKLRTPLSLIPVEAYGSFTAAIDDHNDAGDPPVTLLVGSRMHVTANTTVTANITLQIVPPGALDLDAGVTLTFATGSAFVAPPRQVFYGTGLVAFGNAIAQAYPEWCGAIADNSTDNFVAINRCKNFTGVRLLQFLQGTYRFGTASLCPTIRQTWQGLGKEGVTTLQQVTANFDVLECRDSNGIVVRNMALVGTSGGTGSGLNVTSDADTPADNRFEDLHISGNGQDCARFEGTFRLVLNNIHCSTPAGGRDGFRFGPANAGSASISNAGVQATRLYSNGVTGTNWHYNLGVTFSPAGLTTNNRFWAISAETAGQGIQVIANGVTTIDGAHIEGPSPAYLFAGSGAGVICNGCNAKDSAIAFRISESSVILNLPKADTATTCFDLTATTFTGIQINSPVSCTTLTGTITGGLTWFGDIAPTTAVTRVPGLRLRKGAVGGASGSLSEVEERFRNNASVAGATTIATHDTGELLYVYVYGKDTAGTARFFDVVVTKNGATPTALSSTTVQGAPAARTYTMSTNDLQLAMAAGTYAVTTWGHLMYKPD